MRADLGGTESERGIRELPGDDLLRGGEVNAAFGREEVPIPLEGRLFDFGEGQFSFIICGVVRARVRRVRARVDVTNNANQNQSGYSARIPPGSVEALLHR